MEPTLGKRLDHVCDAIRLKHYSIRTEEAYVTSLFQLDKAARVCYNFAGVQRIGQGSSSDSCRSLRDG